MKYLRVIATFLLILYAAYLSDRIYVMNLKPISNELTGIASVGYALLTWLPRFIFGLVMGINVGRLSNWIWNTNDKF